MKPYRPLVSNPHVLTVLGNYWKRKLDTQRYPVDQRLYRTEPQVQVLVLTQRPEREPLGELVLVHGLEGSGASGYMLTMAQAALEAGYVVNRFHMRSCGGTEHLCNTLYHAGLTGDLRSVLQQFQQQGHAPVHLVGYSLGGNVVLKLAGELGADAPSLIASVCAVSTPIDLHAGARRLGVRSNWIYERRFVRRMRRRVAATGHFTEEQLKPARSLFEFDDRFTARHFGFQGAEHYYETQSSRGFLQHIRIPTLFIQAKDDIFVPFEMYDEPAMRQNPWIRFVATEHGGHLGFLSRGRPRFWLDHAILEWIEQVASFPKPQEVL